MSFTERAGLFPVLLLTGCASPAVVTGPPAGSVVDSYLSRSAANISAMQYRLHQSGPAAMRPVAPSVGLKPAVVHSRLLTSPGTRTAQGAKPGISSIITFAGKTGGFIRTGGSAPTLRAALRTIVPAGHTLVFDKAVKADAPELWSWSGNDRWPYVVNKMLAMRGLKATVNDKTHTVTVEPVQHAQAGKAVSAGSSEITGNQKGGTVKPSAIAPTSRNPFRGSGKMPPSPALNEAGIQTVPPVPVITPKPVQIRHWRIEAGSTVKDWLYSQAATELCYEPGIKHWTVAWMTAVNYRVDAPLSFEGNFRDMLNSLFTLYGTAKVPLYAGVRSAQCVINVDDKEVR